MFGTVLGQVLRSLRTNCWNQDRSGKHREQEICCLVQENPRCAFIRCWANPQILAQEKPKMKGKRKVLELSSDEEEQQRRRDFISLSVCVKPCETPVKT